MSIWGSGAGVEEGTSAESAAQGLAEYLAAAFIREPRQVVVTPAGRNNSERAARHTAAVLSANGFHVMYLEEPRSAAEVSFAVRELRCNAGILVSDEAGLAPENRFRCFWENGAVPPPPHDKGLREAIASRTAAKPGRFDDGLAAGHIVAPAADLEKTYADVVAGHSLNSSRHVSLGLVPLHHGRDSTVAAVLQRCGFDDVTVLECGLKDLPQTSCGVDLESPELVHPAAGNGDYDLVLLADEERGRLGAAVGSSLGKLTLLNGSQIGSLLADHVLRSLTDARRLSPAESLVSNLVSTGMYRRLAGHYGVQWQGAVPPGFDNIVREMERVGVGNVAFAADESHGYLRGAHALERDAAAAAMLLAELAAALKEGGSTLIDKLDALYQGHGIHLDLALSRRFAGAGQAAAVYSQFRDMPPERIGGVELHEVFDYERSEVRSLPENKLTRPLAGPHCPLLDFRVNADENVMVYRTGDELKLYLFGFSSCTGVEELAEGKRQVEMRLQAMREDLIALIEDASPAGTAR